MGRRGPNNQVSEKVIIREEPQKTCVDLKCHRTPMPQVAQTEDEKQEAVVQTKEKW
jgi:hypothetical protein